MAADPNQKLFAQIADLGRNMNSLTDALKKNTSVTESSIPVEGKNEKKSAPNDSKANIDNGKDLKDIGNHLKDISKMLESIVGNKGPKNTIPDKKENKVKIDEPEPKKLVPNESKKPQDKPGSDISSIIKNTKIPKFEKGGDVTKTGPAIVGEKGPEIVNLSKGTKVLPADESASFIDSNKLNVSKGDKDKKDSEYRYEKGVDKKGYNEFLEIVKPDKPKVGQRYPSDNEIRIIKSRLFNDKENSKEDIESELQDYVFNYDREKGEEAEDKEFSDFIKDKSDKTKLDKKDKSEDKEEKKSKKGFFSKLGKKNKSKEEKDEKAEFYSKLAQEEKEEGEAKDASREDKLSKLEKEGFNTKSDEEPKKDKGEDKGEKASKKDKGEDKEEKAPKKGFFSKLFKKDKSKDKDKDETETPDEKKSPDEKVKTEEKKPGLLSKIGKGALGIAGNVAGKFGPGGAVVKAGLGSLKKVDNKKDKAPNEPEVQNKKPALVSDVKKLKPVSKKEPTKEKEAPAEIKSTAKDNPSDDKLTSKSQPADNKKSGDIQNEPTGTDKSGLGSDKDMQDIKNALTRIAGLLEGPLTVSSIDQPFRPDSRRI